MVDMFTSRMAVTGAVLALALALGGCGGGSNDSSTSSGGVTQNDVGAPAVDGKAPEVSGEDAGGFVTDGTLTVDRQVARTASLWLRVDDVTIAISKVRSAATVAGGIVAAEETSGGLDGAKSYSTLTLQVPSDKLDATLVGLGQIGTVAQQNISSVDVTTQVVDVDARVATLKASVARVQAMMAKANTIGELVAIETELTQRQAQLESLEAQQKSLAARVALAPITVTLSTESAPVPEDNAFVRGLKQGWEAFLNSVEGLMVILGALIPFALIAGLVAWPLIAWRRRVGAQKRADRAAHESARPDVRVDADSE